MECYTALDVMRCRKSRYEVLSVSSCPLFSRKPCDLEKPGVFLCFWLVEGFWEGGGGGVVRGRRTGREEGEGRRENEKRRNGKCEGCEFWLGGAGGDNHDLIHSAGIGFDAFVTRGDGGGEGLRGLLLADGADTTKENKRQECSWMSKKNWATGGFLHVQRGGLTCTPKRETAPERSVKTLQEGFRRYRGLRNRSLSQSTSSLSSKASLLEYWHCRYRRASQSGRK